VFVQSRADYEREIREIERAARRREADVFDGKSFRGLRDAWEAKRRGARL
jgi:hypothetical protein